MSLTLRAVRLLGVYADRIELRCTEDTNYQDLLTVESSNSDDAPTATSSATLDRAGVRIVIGYKGVAAELFEPLSQGRALGDVHMSHFGVASSSGRHVYRIRKVVVRPIERCDADDPSPHAEERAAIVRDLLLDAERALRDVRRVYERRPGQRVDALSDMVDAIRTCARAN